MSEKKNQPNSQEGQVKAQVNPVQKQQNFNTSDSKTTDQGTKISKQFSVQKGQKVNLKDRQLNGKRLSLVFYEMMKNKQSLFSEEQKYPLIASMGGILLTLSSVTLINISQMIFKPQGKKQKLFFRLGLANLLASMCLGFYSIYKVSDMYVKIPEAQWDIISIEKQAYDKLSYKEKRAYFEKEMEQEGQKIKEAVLQNELLKRQEKIDLTK